LVVLLTGESSTVVVLLGLVRVPPGAPALLTGRSSTRCTRAAGTGETQVHRAAGTGESSTRCTQPPLVRVPTGAPVLPD